MDWMDFLLKFSSELLIVLLSFTVGGLNWILFGGYSGKNFQDQSLAENFIAKHQGLNPKLYAKNNSIVTLVSGNPFIAQAQAEDFTGLEPQGLALDSSSTDNGKMELNDGNSLLAPNPDSITQSVANVVKKYTTLPGDTLKSIAAANNISVNTIRLSNPNLSGDNISAGWTLLIPPIDGVVVIADSNTTLPDLAVKYSPERYNKDKNIRDAAAAQLLDTIITYNGLDSAEDVDNGQTVIIPGGTLAEAPVVPKPAPKPKNKTPKSPAVDNSINDVTSVSDGYDADNHTFPRGYCTYYVATKMKITFGGNAKNWLANANASGYVTGKEPAMHAAVVMTGPQRTMRRYGHVAYVESVNGDGTITISEMNYEHFNRVDTRVLSINDPSIRGYIYP